MSVPASVQLKFDRAKLDLIDKHRAIVPVYGSLSAVNFDAAAALRAMPPMQGFDPADIPPMVIGLRPAVRCPLQDGDAVWTVASGVSEVDENPTFTIDVAINEPGVLECEPIVGALHQAADLIENAVVQPLVRLLP